MGFECSRDKVTLIDVSRNNDLAKKSKAVLSFNPGFGFERAIHNWIGGIEYSYSIGQKFSAAEMNANAGRTLDAQRRSHQVMFRFSYAFK